MINAVLTNAVTAATDALANVPFTAPDDEINMAVRAAASAVDRVCRIPAFTVEEVGAKLSLAAMLGEWSNLQDRLIEKARCELLTIRSQPS